MLVANAGAVSIGMSNLNKQQWTPARQAPIRAMSEDLFDIWCPDIRWAAVDTEFFA